MSSEKAETDGNGGTVEVAAGGEEPETGNGVNGANEDGRVPDAVLEEEKQGGGGGGADAEDEAEAGRTCGICPRVIKGRLFGSEDGLSVDIYFNPCTMILSIVAIWSFVIWCAVDEDAGTKIQDLQSWIVYHWTWFYVGCLIFFGGFITYLFLSKYGDIKLGPKDEPPRFSLGSWFAMLFSAGVGVGLYFFGVAEPVGHYYDAKNGHNRYYTDGDNLERALDAMNLTWFNWGLTASSVYCVVGLPLAYFAHVKNQPLKFSAAFIPLIGKKYANGFVGDCIDTFAVIGTMFGVSTSLGLGVIQLNAMLAYMTNDVETDDTQLRIVIIWIITAFATVSVFTGLDVGIRRLSEGNFAFCLILLIYLFFICDPYYLTNLFITTVGYHINHLFELTFQTDGFAQAGFTGDTENNYENFMSWWTIFYWGWWIAWSPFVGIFIAQISRGRTIREFILGNMFVPTLFTSIWLCVFGGIGLYNELAFDDINGNYAVDGLIGVNASDYNLTNITVCTEELDLMHSKYKGPTGESNVVYLECIASDTMLFVMIDAYPLGSVMNILAGIGIVTYFVTSSDSASHVIDMLTANGNEEPPKIQRVFWAMSEGACASVLLAVGGSEALSALQTVSIAAGLPFCAILVGLCYAFWYALKIDTMSEEERKLENAKCKWDLDILDSTNPQTSSTQLVKDWFIALFLPCLMQWQNFNAMCAKDENGEIFDKNSNGQKIFWAFLIFGNSLLALVFGLLGFVSDGWETLGLTFYIGFVCVNIWQRMRIRQYFGITGASQGIFCDCLSHLCCAYPWTMVQERVQATSDHAGVISNGVELVPRSPKQMHVKQASHNMMDDDNDNNAAFMD